MLGQSQTGARGDLQAQEHSGRNLKTSIMSEMRRKQSGKMSGEKRRKRALFREGCGR